MKKLNGFYHFAFIDIEFFFVNVLQMDTTNVYFHDWQASPQRNMLKHRIINVTLCYPKFHIFYCFNLLLQCIFYCLTFLYIPIEFQIFPTCCFNHFYIYFKYFVSIFLSKTILVLQCMFRSTDDNHNVYKY